MNIETVKEKKKALDERISSLVRRFEKETRCNVKELKIRQCFCVGKKKIIEDTFVSSQIELA